MATSGQEVEILQGGTNADAPSKGTVVLNMIHRQNAWEVRKGFGQVAQLDTLMGAWTHNPSQRQSGYRRRLGSKLIKTKFGHRQVVTVVTMTVRLGTVEQDAYSQVADVYAVVVHDLDTGVSWEEPVYRHTAENAGVDDLGFDMTKWHGAFESRRDRSYGSFVMSPQNDEAADTCFFVEINDILYFGNNDIGLLAYIPTSFRKRRRRQISTQYWASQSPPYSECCFIKKVFATVPSEDLNAVYTYLSPTAFPKPALAARLGGRMVMAEGRNVFISDSGFPGAVKALNTFVLSSDEDIRAIGELGGNLYLFTDNEVWFTQPSPGPIITKGRTVKIADGVGCAGPNAITKVGNSLVWIDSRGVYRMTGVAQYKRISDPIEPFFTDELSNPLNSFFTDNGNVAPEQDTRKWAMPRSFWRYGRGMVSAAYNERLDATIFSFPAINTMLVFAGGQWAVWPMESMGREEEILEGAGLRVLPVVGALQNIERPWVVADETDIFVVCGIEEQTLADKVPVPDRDSVNRSFAILRYGRGGAVDRSIEDEDFRSGPGSYERTNNYVEPYAADGGVYFQEPVPIRYGRVIPGDPDTTVSVPSFWVPVEIIKPTKDNAGVAFAAINAINIRFTFDNAHWLPILANPVTAEISVMFPSERMASRSGYGVQGGADAPGTREFHLYDSGTNTRSATGDQIRIAFDGASSLLSWTLKPYINASELQTNPLFWIPMARVQGAGSADYTVGMNLSFTTIAVEDTRSVATAMRAWVWNQAFLGDQRRVNNALAQPVDFAYKSGQIGMGDGERRKVRGMFSRVLSHSRAYMTDRVSPNWPVGVFNSVISSDFKGWVSQVVDVAPPEPDAADAVSQIRYTDSVRTRYLGSAAMSKKVFSADETTDHVHYGDKDDSDPVTDTYLVDDEAVDVIATSDSVKGDHHTVMIWGMLRNKAERLALESVKVVMRVVGGRRRSGR